MGRKHIRPFFENIEVLAAASRGKSIGRAPDGRVILISNAIPGDVVSVQVFKKRKGMFEGVATEITHPSPDRISPRCIHFGTCGGCKWQNMAYPAQLKHKAIEVAENLRRIGKVELPEINPIIGAPEIFHYRNKMEFSFSSQRWLEPEELKSDQPITDRNGLGLHIPGMWDKILDLKTCYLQAEPSNKIRLAVREYALKQGIPFFDPRQQTGMLRSLMIRNTAAGDFMVLIQFFQEDLKAREALLNYLSETFPEIKSLYYTINPKANDTIYDLDLICYKGVPYLTETMEDLKFQITPKSFYQTNSEQALALYRIVRDLAGLTGSEVVYDLYTGLGTIAQFIAPKAKKVIGIEAVPEAIAAAKLNAQYNGLNHLKFFAGDMKAIFTSKFLSEHGIPDVIITDPPRDGMHKDVVAQILEIAPERIVYVSCNSATQARDLQLLKTKYKVDVVQPVDMFPQTHHVENVVLLTRSSEPNSEL
jgi:23S rRNA (uracil1939-C5)-methyltransferase